MKSEKYTRDYWFTIESYVFIGITTKKVLLYNTLDGATLESENTGVIELLHEVIEEKNCGVVLLKSERYAQRDIHLFIQDLREKFMGDIIDVALSNGRPIQLFPYFNYLNKHEIYKKLNSAMYKNVLENLSEINIYLDITTDLEKLIPFLLSIPGTIKYNLIGNITDVTNYKELLSFLSQEPSKNLLSCSYTNVRFLPKNLNDKFSIRILVNLPIDAQQWNNSREILLDQSLSFEYLFDVSSEEDCLQTEILIDKFQIDKYRLNPVYTGSNIHFFEKNIFLFKEEILATPMTIKDIFSHQSMNLFDFGKINIMPNGDIYANTNHPLLGNISKQSIDEIVYKEIEEGKSWFRIRNQAPCNVCVYQWLCPPPSNYEILIGRYNLCHVCS